LDLQGDSIEELVEVTEEGKQFIRVTGKRFGRNCFYIELHTEGNQNYTISFLEGDRKATLQVDRETEVATFDRRGFGVPIADAAGEPAARQYRFQSPKEADAMQLFFDVSSLEVFIGEGDAVMTANLYTENQVNVIISGQ